MKNKMIFIDNIELLTKHYNELLHKWIQIKMEENRNFTEYTDDKFEELKSLMSSEEDELMIITKGQSLINEINTLHLNSKINLDSIFSFCASSDKVKYFVRYNNLLTDNEYWKHLGDVYIYQDYQPIETGLLKALFSSNKEGKEYLMKLTERELLTQMANKITIYRGMSEKEFKGGCFGISWSLNESIANSFAERNAMLYGEKHLVHKLNIKKMDITAYFIGRKEEEIIYIK